MEDENGTIRYLHTMVRVKDLEKSMAFYGFWA
jgi:predicted enzyme related to lactoylglutathione lyase